jgi:hypothetical protein
VDSRNRPSAARAAAPLSAATGAHRREGRDGTPRGRLLPILGLGLAAIGYTLLEKKLRQRAPEIRSDRTH